MTPTRADLGHGRGWASPHAAASIRRIDRQLGRPADINEAGRSPEKADENYRRWIAYLNGGPKAPYALPASQSVHCVGDAADSDDWYDPHAAAVWRDNGWKQTARYPGNPKKDEPWHGEYFPHLDNHRHDPAPAAGDTTTPPTPQEDDDMPKNSGFIYRAADQAPDQRTVLVCNTASGFHHEYTNGITTNDSAYNAAVAIAYDVPGPFAEISESHAIGIKDRLTAVLSAATRE